MSVSYIGAGTNKGGASSGTVTSHASTLAGDLLVLLVNAGAGVTSITGGSSPTWTQFGTTQTTANGLTNIQIWTAKAAAGDIGATFTVNYAASTQFNQVLETWRGSATPILTNFQAAILDTSGTAITSSAWSGSNGVAFAGGNSFASTPTCVPSGANWTEIADQANTTLIASDTANDTASSGSNAGCTFTWTQSCTSRAAVTFNVIDISGAQLFFGSN